MDDAVDTLHRLGRKAWFAVVGSAQIIDKALYRVNVQSVQLDRPQGGLDVDPDVFLICLDGEWLYAPQVVPLPDIQPLAHGHF